MTEYMQARAIICAHPLEEFRAASHSHSILSNLAALLSSVRVFLRVDDGRSKQAPRDLQSTTYPHSISSQEANTSGLASS